MQIIRERQHKDSVAPKVHGSEFKARPTTPKERKKRHSHTGCRFSLRRVDKKRCLILFRRFLYLDKALSKNQAFY